MRLELMLPDAQHPLRFSLLWAAVEDLEVGDAPVEPRQGQEFDLLAIRAAHQVDVMKARDAPRLDAGNHVTADDPLISGGIVRRRPPAPQATSRHTRIGIST